MTISSESRGARVALLAILAVAAGLRFWGLGAGIPYSIGVDEPQVLNRALTMMRTGDFNPHFFDYPTLYIYLQLVVACLRFMWGALVGSWSSLSEVPLPEYLVWGRAVTATLGTLTVLVLYRIGLRWSVRHALLAAGLLAAFPLHVRESHFVLTDVPLTFFVTLTWLLALRASAAPTLAAFALAGAAAGLSAATKYPGALALLLPLLTAWTSREAHPSRAAAAGIACLGAGGAFLLAAPFTLLDLPGFLDGYGRLMASYTGTPAGEPAWSIYLKHLRRAAHWPAFLAMLIGVVIAASRAARGPDRIPWLTAAAFPILFFFVISRQSLVFGRYLLPLVPFACMLAAITVMATIRLLPRVPMRAQLRTVLVAALAILVTLPPAIDGFGFNVQHSRTSTAALAYDWLNAHVEPGATIAVEGTDLVLMYSAFRLVQMPRLHLRTYEDYAESGVDYLVASSQIFGAYLAAPGQSPQRYAEYATLFKRTKEVARFVPTTEHPGAELRILRVKP